MKAYIIYIPERFDIDKYLNYIKEKNFLKYSTVNHNDIVGIFNNLRRGILNEYYTPTNVYGEIIEIIRHENFIIDTVTNSDSDEYYGWILNINTTANRVTINGLELEKFEYEN